MSVIALSNDDQGHQGRREKLNLRPGVEPTDAERPSPGTPAPVVGPVTIVNFAPAVVIVGGQDQDCEHCRRRRRGG